MRSLRAVAFLMVGTVGCAPASPAAEWGEAAAAADEASILLASEMALLVVPGNLDPAATPEETAIAAGAAASDAFDPPTCVSTTVEGATIVYALDGCEGSFGLVHATGTMSVTFRVDAPGRTAFTATTTALTLRGATVSFDVEASVVHDAGNRTIDASTSSSGTSQTGRAFERTGAVTARWMDSWGCLFVDSADVASDLAGHTWDVEIRALTYCVGECSMPGGSMTWTREGTAEPLRLDYAGTPSVHWSVGDATASGDLRITCGV